MRSACRKRNSVLFRDVGQAEFIAEQRLVALGIDGHGHSQRRRAAAASCKASSSSRTGTRCTTLTQLPLAFCGGSTDSSAPVDDR